MTVEPVVPSEAPRSETPDVTVIVPTFRRPASLRRTLDGLRAQRGVDFAWELIVIDNEPPPGSEATVHEATASLDARYLRESRRGASHARNRGIAEARGDIVVMIDDDCVPAQDWLARITEPIRAGRSDATGGRVVLDPSVSRPGWFDESSVGAYLTAWDPAPKERSLAPDEFVVSGNAAFRTEVLRATGGFDPALGPRGNVQIVGEDNLLSRRIMEHGATIRYVPVAVVVHELPAERLTRRYLLRRAYLQGRTDWIIDRSTLGDRRLGGARVAVSWIGSELRKRVREGIWRPPVAFHAACDVVRTAGAFRQAAELRFARGR